MNVDQLDHVQQAALDAIGRHLLNKEFSSQHMILNGPGGHGKTATIKTFLSILEKSPLSPSGAVAAWTGRAASQLKNSGIPARTIHSILYRPVMDVYGNLIKFDERPKAEILEEVGDFIIIDEASTINSKMHKELTSLGLPMLYAGDIAQLPSIDRENPNFNVLNDFPDFPTVSLTINHRQSEGSGIRTICEGLREENAIPRMKRDDLKMLPKQSVLRKGFFDDKDYDIVICGMNKTRKKINKLVRDSRGFFEELPEVGEQIVCLQNSMTQDGRKMNNGELFQVTGCLPGDWMSTFFIRSIDDEGSDFTVNVLNSCWSEEQSPRVDSSTNKPLFSFGFGYALSAFKCQGSTFKNVLFYDEDVSFFLDQRAFRYTACSRASEMLTIAV